MYMIVTSIYLLLKILVACPLVAILNLALDCIVTTSSSITAALVQRVEITLNIAWVT